MAKKCTGCIVFVLTLLLSIPAWASVSFDDIGPGLNAVFNHNILFITTKYDAINNTDTAVMYDYAEGSEHAPVPWASIRNEIREVSIGDGVTGISAEAFSECTGLESVSLHASMNKSNSLGQDAFRKCNSIEHVYFYGTQEEWGELKSRNEGTGNACLLNASYIHYMKEPLKLDKYEVTFDAPGYGYPKDAVTIQVLGSSEGIQACESGNPSVAEAKSYGKYMYITPVAEGSCVITVTGTAGDKAEIKVTVTKAWDRYTLRYVTNVEDDEYGSPSVTIYTDRGVKGTFAVGGDAYSFTAADGVAKIKLKKLYRYREAYTLVLQKGSISCTMKGKIRCDTELQMVIASKKKPKLVTLDLESLHKGDTVRFRYKGKTYTKKIKKNGHNRTCRIRLSLKDKLKADSKVGIRVINRYRQTLCRQTVTLKDYLYDAMDDSDGND